MRTLCRAPANLSCTLTLAPSATPPNVMRLLCSATPSSLRCLLGCPHPVFSRCYYTDGALAFGASALQMQCESRARSAMKVMPAWSAHSLNMSGRSFLLNWRPISATSRLSLPSAMTSQRAVMSAATKAAAKLQPKVPSGRDSPARERAVDRQ